MFISSNILSKTETNITIHVRVPKEGEAIDIYDSVVVCIDRITGSTLTICEGQIGHTKAEASQHDLNSDYRCSLFAVYAAIEYLGILEEDNLPEDEGESE